jgi:hypothetical protein
VTPDPILGVTNMKESYSSAHFALRFLPEVGWILVFLSLGMFLGHSAAANYLLAGSGFVSGVVLLAATELLSRLPALREAVPVPDSNVVPETTMRLVCPKCGATKSFEIELVMSSLPLDGEGNPLGWTHLDGEDVLSFVEADTRVRCGNHMNNCRHRGTLADFDPATARELTRKKEELYKAVTQRVAYLKERDRRQEAADRASLEERRRREGDDK